MNKLFRKLENLKPKNEDWVVKTLKRRQKKPIYLAIFIIIAIFSYATYNSYIYYDSLVQKNNKIKTRVLNYNKLLLDINKKIIITDTKIGKLSDLSVDSKRSIYFLNKVCQLLKKREVIGSFYIIKKQDKKFANVLNIEIQVSYGDKDLLFLVTKIVLDKVFYLKEIKQTKIGLIAQIYKPNNEKDK